MKPITVAAAILLRCSSADRVGAVRLLTRLLDGGLWGDDALGGSKAIGSKSPDYEAKAKGLAIGEAFGPLLQRLMKEAGRAGLPSNIGNSLRWATPCAASRTPTPTWRSATRLGRRRRK